MLSVAIIVFRETLEIALILSVVYAASKGRVGRGLWTSLGLAGGAVGAALVALFAGALTRAAAGMGQELFNAVVLFAAATLIGGTAVWMRSHAKNVGAHLKHVGVEVREGKLPLYSLSIVTALAVWREGSEIVLFLYSMAIAGTSPLSLLAGGLLGLAGGVAMGLLMYHGLLKMAARRLFSITSWLLVLLSAGMASQGAKLLVDAGVFTHFITPLWSTAAWLPESSIPGQALHALLGYSARPLGIQLMFYIATLAVLLAAIRHFEHGLPKAPAAAAAALLLLTAPSAHAIDGKIYSPRVMQGEAEIEYAGTRTFDSDKTKNNAQENQFSIGYGFTDFWAAEFYYAVLERGPGQPQDFTGNEFENIFQFWPSHKYWLDAGLLLSYHIAAKRDDADSIEAKLLLQKDVERWTAIVNVGGEREVGAHSVPGNSLATATDIIYRWKPYLSPGLEYQNDLGTWGAHLGFNAQEHYLGPMIMGELLPGLKYELAYLRGISSAAAAAAVRTKIEYEFVF